VVANHIHASGFGHNPRSRRDSQYKNKFNFFGVPNWQELRGVCHVAREFITEQTLAQEKEKSQSCDDKDNMYEKTLVDVKRPIKGRFREEF
jgi:hypothetical protein